MIWYTNSLNTYIHTFCQHFSFVWRCVFLGDYPWVQLKGFQNFQIVYGDFLSLNENRDWITFISKRPNSTLLQYIEILSNAKFSRRIAAGYYISFHCVKNVHIRSYSGSFFPAFGLNMERYFSRGDLNWLLLLLFLKSQCAP